MIEQNIKLKKDNNKITSDPLSFIIEFIIYNENLYAIENPFYAEHKRFAFFIFLIQIYHQAGEYIINPKMGFMCVQYFMEKPEKLDLYQIYECDIFRYMRKDELEIKKSECLIQILRLLHDRIETKDYFEKLITVDSTLYFF